jgi:hypothetical protein
MSAAFTASLCSLSVIGSLSYCGAALLTSHATMAQTEQPIRWTAMSATAMGITGNIAETRDQFIIENQHLTLTPVRRLEGRDLGYAAKLLQATLSDQTRGEVYKTYLSANVHLQGTNTLCGRNATSWVVVLRTVDRNGGSNLDLAFFSGREQPDLTPTAISNSKELCSTFWYRR